MVFFKTNIWLKSKFQLVQKTNQEIKASPQSLTFQIITIQFHVQLLHTKAYISTYLHICIFAATCLIHMKTGYFLQMCSTTYKIPTALVCIIAKDWLALFDSYFVSYWTGYYKHWYSYWNGREGGRAQALKEWHGPRAQHELMRTKWVQDGRQVNLTGP